MPPRARALRLSPAARRSQLLECAIRVLARRGLERGGHAEVAREAGVAVPTVFSYFKTRGELVAEGLKEIVRFYDGMASAQHEPGKPAPRALVDFALSFAASVDRQPDYASILLDWSTGVRSELWPSFLEFHRSMVERLETTIRRGQAEGSIPVGLDANDAALILVGEAHLVVQMKFAHTPPGKVHRFLLALVRAAIGPEAVERGLA